MKTLSTYITEGLKIGKKYRQNKTYNYHPKDRDELYQLLKKLIEERGKDADLNDIDTSGVTDMSYLFRVLDPHNIDISEWDVNNVNDMQWMFNDCKNLKNIPSWYKE